MRIAVGLQDEINEFIEEVEGAEKTSLSDAVIAQILKDMIDGRCHINASKTDHEIGKMWVEFEWRGNGRQKNN